LKALREFRKYKVMSGFEVDRALQHKLDALNSAVLWVGRPGLDFQQEKRDFFLLHNVQTGSGTHSASYPVDTRGFFPG
jgi:hypothetical protein